MINPFGTNLFPFGINYSFRLRANKLINSLATLVLHGLLEERIVLHGLLEERLYVKVVCLWPNVILFCGCWWIQRWTRRKLRVHWSLQIIELFQFISNYRDYLLHRYNYYFLYSLVSNTRQMKQYNNAYRVK